jgi:hypothetical protein
MANFKDWWDRIGSAIRPIDGHDYEEHAYRIAGLAVKACCRKVSSVPDSQITLTKEELSEISILISESVNRGIHSAYIGAVYYEMVGGQFLILDVVIVDGYSRPIDENQRYQIEEYVQAYS